MLGNRPMSDWVAQYSQSHQHPLNRVLHTWGIPMIAVSVILGIASLFVSGLWMVALALFVVGWVLQFVGHAMEGQPPEFFKDWRFLLVGLRWWIARLEGRGIRVLPFDSSTTCRRQAFTSTRSGRRHFPYSSRKQIAAMMVAGIAPASNPIGKMPSSKCWLRIACHQPDWAHSRSPAQPAARHRAGNHRVLSGGIQVWHQRRQVGGDEARCR